MISMCFGEKLILWVSKENLYRKTKQSFFFSGFKKTKLEDKGRRWIKKNKNFPFFLK